MPGHPEGREVLQLTCVAVDFCRNPDVSVRDNIFWHLGGTITELHSLSW